MRVSIRTISVQIETLCFNIGYCILASSVWRLMFLFIVLMNKKGCLLNLEVNKLKLLKVLLKKRKKSHLFLRRISSVWRCIISESSM